MRSVLLSVGAGFLVACGEPEAPIELEAVYAPLLGETGTRVVVSHAAPDTVHVQRAVLRIGSTDGDDRYTFQDVVDIAVSADQQQVFVADAGRLEIVVFDGSGSHVRTIGGRGEGPGEFMSLSDVDWHEGVLLAVDPTLHRFTTFDANGVVERTLPIPGSSEGIFAAHDPSDEQQRAYLAAGAIYTIDRSDPMNDIGSNQRGWLLAYDRRTFAPETVTSFPVAPITTQTGGSERAGYVSYERPPVFSPSFRWDVSSHDEVAFLSSGGVYDFYVIDLKSSTVRTHVYRDHAAARVTRSDRIRLLEYEMGRSDQGVPDGMPMSAVELIVRDRFARIRPPITELLADEARVWLASFSTVDHPTGVSSTWEIFDRSGQPVGVARFPSGFILKDLGPNQAFGLMEDSLGVQFVYAFPKPTFDMNNASNVH